ncbi:MAG: flagellin [Planctomycetia bacterium]|nr:flagellin [Planctomycetia bacterium]
MTLRINTNLAAIRALKNLRATDQAQQTSLERLSTGLRINRASDDPSGLVISEQLRGQISGLKQASENTQNATNMIGTADAALQQVSDLLNDIRQSAIFALNTGASSPDQVAAEQASVDQAVAAINRIAQTTRFADGSLLNGTKGYQVTAQNAAIQNLDLRRVSFAPGATSRTFAANYTTAATRRTIAGIGASAGAATIRVTGALGSREISFAAATAAVDVQAAIDAVAQETGVFFSAAGTAASEGFGKDQFINIELLSGTIAGLAAGSNTGTAGVDGTLLIDGQTFTGKGNHFEIHSGNIDASLDIAAGTATGAIATFLTVANSGVEFQVNETASPTDRIALGIRDISASKLGFDIRVDVLTTAASGSSTNEGGFLSSLLTGGSNDLINNPGNALQIIDAAVSQVTGLRGFLGALQSFNLEPNLNNLEVSIENITAAESSIRDLDFAAETAEFTRTQVLFQAGVSVLGSANLIPQTVLTLLQ